MNKQLGILFSVFDGDQTQFHRFGAELRRLGLPFAVNFDHCCRETKQFFSNLPTFVDGYENDDPESFFDESHRQTALSILQVAGFEWALSMDVDETLEPGALERISEVLSLGADVVDCQLLDLWGGSDRYYRVDGTFGSSHREKFFNLKSDAGKFEYYHPTVHAPKIINPKREVTVVKGYPFFVLHWGIMDMVDVVVHTKRFDDIYMRKVGGNPYGFYPYLNDPKTVPELRETAKALATRSR